MIIDYFEGDLNTKIILLGWAFKQKTNDTRESVYICSRLFIEKNAEIHVYDPMVSVKKIHNDIINLWDNQKPKSTKQTFK